MYTVLPTIGLSRARANVKPRNAMAKQPFLPYDVFCTFVGLEDKDDSILIARKKAKWLRVELIICVTMKHKSVLCNYTWFWSNRYIYSQREALSRQGRTSISVCLFVCLFFPLLQDSTF